ncbi:hypothetical protein [Jiangella alba]|uniref:hypothetical protein n=1 Tax=Jiangella alba TaxID=561176 RepID=UPI00114CDB98|nr:hypothetical protein [Jiangella alba]
MTKPRGFVRDRVLGVRAYWWRTQKVWERQARWVRPLAWLVVVAASAWLVKYVYDLLRDESEPDAVAAAIQTGLAVATIILVWYTVRQVGQSQQAAERVAHDSLLERLEARGPRAVVSLGKVIASLRENGKVANVGLLGDRYVLGDDVPLAGKELHLTLTFRVKVFGDAPAFAVAAPGTLADVDETTRQVVEPGSDGVLLRLTTILKGEQIREVAMQGEWKLKPFSQMWQSVVEVTDATHTVKDTYIFHIGWWPFEREGVTTLISKFAAKDKRPSSFAQAYRSYDVDLARTDPPRR